MFSISPWWFNRENKMVYGGDKATYVCEISGAKSNKEAIADGILIENAPDLYYTLELLISSNCCANAYAEGVQLLQKISLELNKLKDV